MITKGEKNYFINVALFITGFACIFTGIMLDQRPSGISIPMWFKPLHIYIGYVLAALVLLHLMAHIGWIRTVTKSIFQDKKKVLILALVAALAVSACYFAATLFTKPEGHYGNKWRYGNKYDRIPFSPPALPGEQAQ